MPIHHMLKVKTKFRLIIAFYMALPITVIFFSTQDSDLFLDHSFQTALSICLAMIIGLTLCSPLLLGFKWLFFKQIQQISKICSDIRNGNYHYFPLPNEPNETGDENELIFLMRNMNWMIRQIEIRESELENRVAKRTRALEQTNAKLVIAGDEAKASAQAKSRFLATMSHEIRTPLNAVMGMSDTVLKTPLNSRQEECMQIIYNSSKSLLKIINDILDFSKMDAEKLCLENIPVAVRDLLEEVSDLFRHETAEKQIEFIIDIDAGVPGKILADPLRLRQMLINLVSNAFKFTARGEIRILAALEESRSSNRISLVFSIMDTGIGMDDKTVQTLFTAFTQADGSTSRKFGGTGLGLAICKKLAVLMGGDITVKSTPGKGSCFTLTIDAAPFETSGEKPDENPMGIPYTAFQGTPVLLAAGNQTTGRIMDRFLVSFGFDVTSCTTWAGVRDELERNQGRGAYYLAVIDMDMEDPDLSGAKSFVSYDKPPFPIIGFGGLSGKAAFNPPAWVEKIISKPVKQSSLFDAIMETVTNSDPVSNDVLSGCRDFFSHPRQTRILLVEDNPINQRVALEIFATAGVAPVVVDSGEKALDCIKNQSFDAIMMDVQMPNMDGYETTRQIRQLAGGKTVPIIAMTANAMEDDRTSGLEAGMDAYMTKPVEPALLFSTLSKLLNRPGALNTGLMNQRFETAECLLEDLPGINTRTAQARLGGNLSLLKDLVVDFAGENSTIFDRLHEWAGQGRKDQILSEVHRLKGISRNLSADSLADSLAELEKTVTSLKDRADDPKLVSCLAKSRFEFEQILETAARLEDRMKGKPPVRVLHHIAMPGPVLELAGEMAATLKQLLDGHSLKAKDYTRQFSRHLAGTAFEPEARTLEAQIKRFDFEKAKKTFEALHSGIRSALPDTVTT